MLLFNRSTNNKIYMGGLKMKKFYNLLVVLLAFVMIFSIAACNNTTDPSSSTGGSQSQSSAPAEKINVKFYGKIVEFTSGVPMVEALQEKLKDKYTIEAIQVDWGNLDTVIKTGIASGEPNHIYAKQGQIMSSYVNANQALDLTPYLEANNNEWKNEFAPGTLEIGMYDGKYYNAPLNTNLSALFVNVSVFADAGVTIPDKWTWSEFMSACEKISTETEATPFVITGGLNHFLPRNGVLSLGKDQNLLEDLALGLVPATSDIFATAIRNTKELFDKGYWYPDQGAMTISRDEATAAFLQGKVAMLGEVTAVASNIVSNADFDVQMVRWPSMGTQSVVLGGADGFFIPANTPDKDASIEVLKVFLSKEIQQIHADAGYAAVNANVVVNDPIIQAAMALSSDVYPQEFQTISQKMTDYWTDILVTGYVLGTAESKILGDMEVIRLEAIE